MRLAEPFQPPGPLASEGPPRDPVHGARALPARPVSRAVNRRAGATGESKLRTVHLLIYTNAWYILKSIPMQCWRNRYGSQS